MDDVFVAKEDSSLDDVIKPGQKVQDFSDKDNDVSGIKKKAGLGLFSAYFYYPRDVNFVNKEPGENVIFLLRKHPVTNLGWILLLFPLIVIPAFISAMSFFGNLPIGFQILIFLIWYLLVFGFAIQKYLDWFFNVDIVTEERVVDVDFENLTYRQVTDADLDEIQEVTVEMGGPLRTFFNFGNVIIQTAAEISRVDFLAVPFPDTIAKVLRELKEKREQTIQIQKKTSNNLIK